MSRGAPKSDLDIKMKMRGVSSVVDTAPCQPEYIAFKMRPRDKAKEIGPEFRLNPRVQM